MRHQKVTAQLGIPLETQKLIISLMDDVLHDFYVGLYDEEMALLVVANRVKDLSKKEQTFACVYYGQRFQHMLKEAHVNVSDIHDLANKELKALM